MFLDDHQRQAQIVKSKPATGWLQRVLFAGLAAVLSPDGVKEA